MRWYPFLYTVLATQLAGQQNTGVDRLMAEGGPPRPRVLRSAEPSDSVIVTLPGARTAAVNPPLPIQPPPAIEPADADDHRPLLRRAPKPILPAEFERDSAGFTQKMIGLWSEPDAYNLYGEPLRERIVLDEGEAESGRIYAFSDPTGRYREIELDFSKDAGLLRTVFVYPWKMSWQECRKIWSGRFTSTEANKGRTFHSYVDRRLDVLVDEHGNVISLGLY